MWHWMEAHHCLLLAPTPSEHIGGPHCKGKLQQEERISAGRSGGGGGQGELEACVQGEGRENQDDECLGKDDY